MKSRIMEGPSFEFSAAQREDLKNFLPQMGEAADRFLAHIESPLGLYCITRSYFENDPVPVDSVVNARLKEASRSASVLSEVLENADPLGEYYPVVDAVARILSREGPEPDFSSLDGEEWIRARLEYESGYEIQSEKLLGRLAADLPILDQALRWQVSHIEVGRKGRRVEMQDVLLLEQIAQHYLNCFGELPSHIGKGSTFDKLVTRILKYAGFPQTSWHRALKRAVDRLGSSLPQNEPTNPEE